jgi:UDP-4-amino-4,6-dideoxy-N-acetyl-beta-L-altrosamine N-acetyltransferase
MKLVFKNFTALMEKEIKLVFDMRNSESVRLKMYNPEPITYSDHKEWISRLKTKKDRLYFLSFYNDNPIGVVDFTSINDKNECEWGYYLNPELQNSGYGILLEYYVIKYAFEELQIKHLFGAVIETNKKLFDSHVRQFGFMPDSSHDIQKEQDGKTLLFKGMVLHKNDWLKWKNPVVEKWIKIFNVTDFFVLL